jgi:hypothetical protein
MGKLNPRFFATQILEISKIEKSYLFLSLIFQICVAKIGPEASGLEFGISELEFIKLVH